MKWIGDRDPREESNFEQDQKEVRPVDVSVYRFMDSGAFQS